MGDISKDLVPFLQYLLPGFLAAWIFYGFTSFLIPSQFERIVQALIFTVIIQVLVFFEKTTTLILGKVYSIGTWTEHSQLISSLVTACVLGVIMAYSANNDTFHKMARKFKITRDTSYPSEWFGTFSTNITYIVLHLEDDRRLYGWPKEWPSQPDKGHFVIEEASWLDEENKQFPITGVSLIMINVKDVKMVEFMTKTWEDNDEENLESTTTETSEGPKRDESRTDKRKTAAATSTTQEE